MRQHNNCRYSPPLGPQPRTAAPYPFVQLPFSGPVNKAQAARRRPQSERLETMKHRAEISAVVCQIWFCFDMSKRPRDPVKPLCTVACHPEATPASSLPLALFSRWRGDSLSFCGSARFAFLALLCFFLHARCIIGERGWWQGARGVRKH